MPSGMYNSGDKFKIKGENMSFSKKEKLTLVAKQAGYRTLSRFHNRANFIFNGLPLKGLRALEIGCGSGAFCFWLALNGAEYVLGIEPEADGCIAGSIKKFNEIQAGLNLDNIEFRECFLENLSAPEKPYNIIIMLNVINHLDENAVQQLHRDEKARIKYVDMLKNLKQFISKDGFLIVADCGRKNFWNSLGLKSPFIPAIEWEKHQEPDLWINLFKKAGFELYDFRWSSIYPLGFLSSNRVVQYLTMSHFTLRFKSI
jgi:2-polyprenyl-3-methyl-5-hydroxy-6-metoxy-1,4-benzoquinol methylase